MTNSEHYYIWFTYFASKFHPFLVSFSTQIVASLLALPCLLFSSHFSLLILLCLLFPARSPLHALPFSLFLARSFLSTLLCPLFSVSSFLFALCRSFFSVCSSLVSLSYLSYIPFPPFPFPVLYSSLCDCAVSVCLLTIIVSFHQLFLLVIQSTRQYPIFRARFGNKEIN